MNDTIIVCPSSGNLCERADCTSGSCWAAPWESSVRYAQVTPPWEIPQRFVQVTPPAPSTDARPQGEMPALLTDDELLAALRSVDPDAKRLPPGLRAIGHEYARAIYRAMIAAGRVPKDKPPRCTCLTNQLGPDYCEVHAA